MKTFKNEEKVLQNKNYQINNEYWLGKMYDKKCSDKKKLKVFGNINEFNSYHNLMQKKLFDASIKNGCDKVTVLENIIGCELYRNTFAKNPKKQRLHESVQYDNICEVINELRDEHNELTITINNNDNNSRFVVNENGELVAKRGKRSNSYKETKMFDYVINITNGKKRCTLYLLNKYTHEKGGSQDSTRREMQQAHKYCTLNKNKNTYFCFVLDGGYWKEIVANIRTNKNIIRTTSFEFKNTLVKFLQKNKMI